MLSDPIKDDNVSFILPDQTCQRLTLAEVESATNNFDEALVIGRGGFGKVYKSLSNFGSSVTEVAIKRLHSASSQGAFEFEAEVKLLSTLRHGNLVPLIGYCSEGKEMVLVYEFMPNGTLEDHLHKGVTELSWLQRLKICVGAARGLDYLHTGTSTQRGVIHRDVKTSNILLDSKFTTRISDFGLAKVGPIDQTRTHVSTLVRGTFGYMDPCYFYSGQLTRKSDVYAFGVVLFEVLSGKRAVDQSLEEYQWSLAVWAQDRFKEGRLNELIDHSLMGQISKKGLKEFAGIAVHCLHYQPKQRPTMAELVAKLDSIMSRERERAGSGVDDGRFINKVRSIFTGKGQVMPEENKADLNLKSVVNKGEVMPEENKADLNLKSVVNKGEVMPEENKADLNLKSVVNKGEVMPEENKADLNLKSEFEPGAGIPKSEKFNHPNLVNLLRHYSNEQEEQFCFVYKLCQSLDKLLYGAEAGKTSLSWVARLNIAVGAAKGLSFLHKKGHPAYKQFKTSCILVDKDYNARLWEFEVDDSFVALGSYSFKGDAHYAAPEWFRYQADVKMEGTFVGKAKASHKREDDFGVKSEIYSFGVVLLEILTGMKAVDRKRPAGKHNLVNWATPLLPHEENLGMIMDPHIMDNNDPPKGAFMLAELVSNCLQPSPDNRPSMEKVLQVLNECYIQQFDS